MQNFIFTLLPYNLRRVREYSQRIYHTMGDVQTKRKEILVELFELTNAFLQDLEIEYWINFGTLLGYHRENTIIDHDIDLDFGCHERYYPLIKQHLLNNTVDLKIYDTSFRHPGPKLYVSYKGFDADIYFYKEEGDKLFSYEETKWENYKAGIPSDFVFPLKEVEFLNKKTFVPSDTKNYLKTIYGSLNKNAIRNSTTGYWELPPTY